MHDGEGIRLEKGSAKRDVIPENFLFVELAIAGETKESLSGTQLRLKWVPMYGNLGAIGYVYILASAVAGTLYIGVTSDLIKRISEHKNGIYGGFTAKYNVHRLVYYEVFGSIELAIEREKKLKKWRREWKIQLIEKENPKWADLYPALVG
jgi:putative endonuclease